MVLPFNYEKKPLDRPRRVPSPPGTPEEVASFIGKLEEREKSLASAAAASAGETTTAVPAPVIPLGGPSISSEESRIDPALWAAAAPRPQPLTMAEEAVLRAVPEDAPVVAATDPPPVSRSGQVMDENAARARRIETDASGKPIANRTIASGVDRRADLKERVDEYEPQKAKGWRRWLPLLVGTGSAVASTLGRDPETARRTAFNVGRNLGDPALADRQWKAEQQESLNKQADADLDKRKAETTIAHVKAQTKKLEEPEVKSKRMQIVKSSKGIYVAVDADTGKDQDGNTVQFEQSAETSGWVLKENEQGVWVPVDKNTGKGQDGQPVKGSSKIQLEDGSFVDATTFNTQKYATDRQFASQDRNLNISNQEAAQANAQLQQQVEGWKQEREQLDQALKTTPQMVTRKRRNSETQLDEEYETENPVYSDYMGRRRAVNDKILGVQLKPIVKAPPRPTVTSGRAKIPAKTSREQQLRELGIP